MKKCSRCGRVKSHREFQANRGAPYGKRPDCKSCCAKLSKEYRRKHKKAIAARKKNFYERNKQKIMEQHREYQAANPEKIRRMYAAYRKKNRDRIASWWVKTPRGRFCVLLKLALKRRPTKHPATVDDLMELWKNQNGRCAITGLTMTWRQGETQPTSLSIDRIDNAGDYTLNNLRLVCYQVNTFRGRWSDAQMLAMAKAIVAHIEKK